MTDPQAVNNADIAIKVLLLLLGIVLTILQGVMTYYFGQIRKGLLDLSYMFFHHRHKDCECDQDGKGDVFIPTQYQK